MSLSPIKTARAATDSESTANLPILCETLALPLAHKHCPSVLPRSLIIRDFGLVFLFVRLFMYLFIIIMYMDYINAQLQFGFWWNISKILTWQNKKVSNILTFCLNQSVV